MKNQFKKLICVLAGHRMCESTMFNNNVQSCLRCGDTRAFYYDGTNFWTDQEYYGLIGYPIWKIKNYFLAAWIYFKLKIGKLKINNRTNKDNSDECPF